MGFEEKINPRSTWYLRRHPKEVSSCINARFVIRRVTISKLMVYGIVIVVGVILWRLLLIVKW